MKNLFKDVCDRFKKRRGCVCISCDGESISMHQAQMTEGKKVKEMRIWSIWWCWSVWLVWLDMVDFRKNL
jgi:hypothetical protein